MRKQSFTEKKMTYSSFSDQISSRKQKILSSYQLQLHDYLISPETTGRQETVLHIYIPHSTKGGTQ